MPDVRSQIKLIPSNPGIYKFLDEQRNYLYIGKAKNLHKRVSSYFGSENKHTGRIRIMLSKVHHIDYTIVESESEALLLENSLIKKIQPKYNVRLKDGKTYPFLCLIKEPFPRLMTIRNIRKDGSEYFGPFVSGLNKNYLLDVLSRHFYIRNCNYHLSPENIKSHKFHLCLRYHIKLCKGPCEALQSEEDYNKNMDYVRNILKGKTASVIKVVKTEMLKASENFEFEKAHELKNTLEALQNYQAKSTVVNPKISNTDVFSIYSNAKSAVVNYLRITNGCIIQTDTVEYVKQLEEKDEDILTLAISEFRERFQSHSKAVIVPFKPLYKFENLNYIVPEAGDKKRLLELSFKNACFYFQESEKKKDIQKNKGQRMTELLKKVQTDLGLQKIPFHIECFDNSNIQGSYPVAAMSVFINGKPDKRAYRHFNIKSVEGPDDFASMEEVIFRRYKRVLEEGQKLPDLIVIDGGKGQINSAYKSLKKLDLHDKIELIGIAKRLEEIYKFGDPFPLGVDKKSPSNKLMQQIRNEAHRFGIAHHRNIRIKGGLVTELDGIKGIGKTTVRLLLSHFKSVENIRKAPLTEIEKLIGKHRADVLLNYFSENP